MRSLKFPSSGRDEATIRSEIQSIQDYIKQYFAGTLPGKPDIYPHQLAIDTWAELSTVNPNNSGIHTRETTNPLAKGRSSAWDTTRKLERELIGMLADLYNLPETEVDGYVTNGGTEGNLAGLWIGRNLLLGDVSDESGLRPSMPIAVIAARTAHYSVRKVCNLLGLGEGYWRKCPKCGHSHEFVSAPDGSGLQLVDVDDTFAIDLDAFEQRLRELSVLGVRHALVIATVGTTITGSVDPIKDMCALLRSAYDAWGIKSHFHVDAAFGGLVLPFIQGNSHTNSQYAIDWSEWPEVASLCVNWHKMGLVPYGAGTFLCRKNLLTHVQRHVAYSMTGMDTTVVGSRSGAMAAACWAVVQMMGYEGFQVMVSHCMTTAKRLRHALENLPEVELLPPAPVNLVALRLLDKASSTSKTREMLGRHRIYPDWLSRRASDCPEEIFPIYLMPHVTTDDVDRFVADLATTFC